MVDDSSAERLALGNLAEATGLPLNLLERFDDLFGSIWGDGLRDRNSLSFQLFAQEELRFALSLSLWRFT